LPPPQQYFLPPSSSFSNAPSAIALCQQSPVTAHLKRRALGAPPPQHLSSIFLPDSFIVSSSLDAFVVHVDTNSFF
jgi:hypothetical protein